MANDQPAETPRDDDLRLQVSSEDLLLDIDPNVPVEFLKKAQALSGKAPPRKAPRDILVETHNSHVQKQVGKPKATNLVKKPILALAYPASYKPVAELEKVSFCPVSCAFCFLFPALFPHRSALSRRGTCIDHSDEVMGCGEAHGIE